MKITVIAWVLDWEDTDSEKFEENTSTAWIKDEPEVRSYSQSFIADNTPDKQTTYLIGYGLLWLNDWSQDDTVVYIESVVE